MHHKDTKIAVLGDGGWGTTLSLLLAEKGNRVFLWGNFAPYVKQIARTRENIKFLPGFKIPPNVCPTSDLKQACSADVLVLAAPSQYLRSVLQKLDKTAVSGKTFVIVAKGVETSSLKTMSQVLREVLGPVKFAVISGPNIAREVAQKLPAAASVASPSAKVARQVRQLFSNEYFSLYESSDVLGVELGGSLKNVIAICAGMIEGLGLGSNTRAVLFARGIAEMARMGKAMGAKKQTFMGLSGLGDLATTCLSQHSRNRSLGCEIGKGKSLQQILKKSEMVVEGVETAKAVHRLSKKHKVPMPISEAVYAILFEKKKPELAIKALLHSGLKKESD